MPLRMRVLGVPVDAVTEKDALAFVRECVRSRRPAQVATVNVEYVIRARADPEFLGVLERAALCTPDSAGILWSLRRHGVNLVDRVGGSDLVWSISELAAREGVGVFLLGGGPGVAARAADVLRAHYPTIEICGTYVGSPDACEREYIVDLIRRSGASILFVAFGAPHQDLWIAHNGPGTQVVVAMGVGGSLDYVAGTVRRAPIWMRRHGLEWLWRLALQPWRWRRMLALPQFVWLEWREGWRARRGGGNV